MMKFIDSILNRITMYRVALYYLIFLLVAALGLSLFGKLPYNPALLLFSAVYITFVCWLMNLGFAYVFNAPTNVESVYITALILVFLITPPSSLINIQFLFFGYIASVIAIGSKYILAIKKKHVFNPAAIAVVLTALIFNLGASWWVGTTILAPFVLFGGLLMVKKIIRFDLVMSFILVALAGIIGSHFANQATLLTVLQRATLSSPLLFFAFVMLTEPLTTPPSGKLRVCYGALAGFLFVPDLHIGTIFSTPELALVVGNIFSYLVSSKQKLFLSLKEIKPISTDCYDFIFNTDKKFDFIPGQYMEWTLQHPRPDSRGNRRYFTITSPPGESTITMGVRFFPESSSYKKSLLAMKRDDTIVAAQLAGDFVLPKKPEQKLVFIAGGIGITPFHSMISHLVNHAERRPITMFYSSRNHDDFAYTHDFDAAEAKLGIKTVYTVTDEKSAPPTWGGEKGRVTEAMIKKYVPDYKERVFYISGPHTMITAFEKTLQDMGITRRHIKNDFFPGLV